MNKFIALALFALCATLAHGQILGAYPHKSVLIAQQGGSAGSSAAAAAASAASSSTSANNNGIISSVGPAYVSPLAPYVSYGTPYYGSPYGYGHLGAPWGAAWPHAAAGPWGPGLVV